MSGVKGNANVAIDADNFGQNDDSLENGGPKKEEKVDVKSKKRKKCLRDKAAPRPPLSGYIRFLNDRRDQFRAENPNLPFAEITKMLATEWNQLPGDKKQQYLSAAEQDRVKYIEELTAYRKTDAYKSFIQRKAKKKKPDKTPDKIPEIHEQKLEKGKEKEIIDNKETYEIPIYSEEFLNFNRARECELRNLRKTVTDQEQEVSVLDKHIENMNNGINKLVSSTDQLKKSCENFEDHLKNLRSKFLDSFSNMQLPDDKECPSLQNIDQFVLKLALLLKTGADSNLMANVRRAVSNLDVSQF